MTTTSPTSSPWTPPPTVTDHLGRPLPPTLDFFQPPPPEIGRILTAFSDVKQGQPLRPIPVKLALYVGLPAILITAAAFLVPHLPGVRPPTANAILSMAAILALAVGGWLAVRKCRVTYVGQDGVALFSTTAGRDQAVPQVARFADVADLSLTRAVRQRKTTNTTWAYELRLTDPAGRDLLHLKGEYNETVAGRRPRHDYDFALAAERAWQRHTADRPTSPLATGKPSAPFRSL